ncbi:LCP family protein [Kitasatospora sp. NPDC088346]|uniref:LCP family protein n=1 Tax=Kitasatospora sp. NPDC088346 TaxID=3364073 RepID=UPI0037F7A5A7
MPSTPARRSRPPRSRWGQWAAGALSLAVLTASGGGWAMVHGVSASIGRVDAFSGDHERPEDDGAITFLLVGTDEREGIPAATLKDVLHAGGESCHCTDTMMLVQLAGDGGRATVISIPRDSYVDIPAHQDLATRRQVPAGKGKINAAFGMGGAALTVQTVEQNTGLRIDHYLQVDFLTFVSTVDAVGGVDVCSAKPLRDEYSGLDLPAGKTRLDGAGALKYVRARYVDGSADLGRMHRQQKFLAQLLRQTTAGDTLLDPAKLARVTDTVLRSVKADQDLSSEDLIRLVGRLKDLSAAEADFTTVPLAVVDHQVAGWGSTVLWDRPAAKVLFDAVRHGRPLTERPGHPPATATATATAAGPAATAAAAAGTVPPGQIHVRVLNGTGVQGLGARVDTDLHAAGFATTGTPGNAPAAARTTVRYDPRWEESARTVAAALPGAELLAVADLGATVEVVVGGDHHGVAEVPATAPPPAPSAPSTSAPSTATPAPVPPGPSVARPSVAGPSVAAETGSEISCP